MMIEDDIIIMKIKKPLHESASIEADIGR